MKNYQEWLNSGFKPINIQIIPPIVIKNGTNTLGNWKKLFKSIGIKDRSEQKEFRTSLRKHFYLRAEGLLPHLKKEWYLKHVTVNGYHWGKFSIMIAFRRNKGFGEIIVVS